MTLHLHVWATSALVTLDVQRARHRNPGHARQLAACRGGSHSSEKEPSGRNGSSGDPWPIPAHVPLSTSGRDRCLATVKSSGIGMGGRSRRGRKRTQWAGPAVVYPDAHDRGTRIHEHHPIVCIALPGDIPGSGRDVRRSARTAKTRNPGGLRPALPKEGAAHHLNRASGRSARSSPTLSSSTHLPGPRTCVRGKSR